ncbi:hypothetical protein DFJ73DRAFT_811799 [Zopfochytrium polystomum]|nr:hypothetical protein DFJ73DRAFT_820915 [Zopfochytrium polystomum]KAI9362975.1 hypothetical protein DFJ73DRAFT_811799 [Zopfochytrium polystomum]
MLLLLLLLTFFQKSTATLLLSAALAPSADRPQTFHVQRIHLSHTSVLAPYNHLAIGNQDRPFKIEPMLRER